MSSIAITMPQAVRNTDDRAIVKIGLFPFLKYDNTY
jgi:hypothetical protein